MLDTATSLGSATSVDPQEGTTETLITMLGRRLTSHGSSGQGGTVAGRGLRRVRFLTRRQLLSDLGMECLDPVQYLNHYHIFLDFIMMHGFADERAGTYRWGDNVLR